MKTEFLRDRDDFELQRKEQLTSALTLPVGVLGGLGSVMALMARSFTYKNVTLAALFVPLLALALIAFAVCLLYLSRAYHRQTYLYLPLLGELHGWEEEFREFNAYVRSTGGDVEATFEEHLQGRIIEAADRNTSINDERSNLLYRSRVALLTVLWLTMFAGVPYVADQVRFSMPRQEAPQQPAPAPSQPAPQNTTPQPPQFPPNREIREGDLPRR